jgi:hypothetical protein
VTLPMHEMPQQAKPFERGHRWLRRLLTCFLFTLVGTLLMVVPWMAGWDQNFFSGSRPGWYSLWMNPYFRGAISGVGMLNLVVSFLELFHLLHGHDE